MKSLQNIVLLWKLKKSQRYIIIIIEVTICEVTICEVTICEVTIL